jgi:hypothetical protein
LRDAFAIEAETAQQATPQADWRGDFERQARAVGFDVAREEIGSEYRHPIAADAFRWYYTGRLDEACSSAHVEQHEAAPAAQPSERGIYAWIAEGSAALVHVHTRPTDHSPGNVLNGSLIRNCTFYDGCAIEQWSGGTWYGPLKYPAVNMKPEPQPAPSAPLEGTGNGADERAAFTEWCERFPEISSIERLRAAWRDARAPRTEVADERIGWAWISPTGHVSSFTADFDGKHDQLSPGWQVRPVAFADVPTRTEVAGAATSACPTCGGSQTTWKCTCEPMWKGYAPHSADAAAEDKYVTERLSTVLAGVAAALLGEEADRPAAETLQKLPEEAAKLRLELDLYRAQAADAAAAPADERVAFEAWMRTGELDLTPTLERDGDVYDDFDTQRAWRGWQARAAASQPAAAAGQEAVAWQYRPIIDGKPYPWIECAKEAFELLRADDYREIHEVRALYTAPPAQVATRQGMTEALRQAREELSNVEWENDPPARVTDLFSTIDALLEGAKQ